MTSEELTIVKALCYKATMHHAAKGSHKFVTDLGAKVYAEPEYPLSEKQQAFLYSLLHRYRRQLPELHQAHCRDKECRRVMRNQAEKERSQLALF